jgi:hypothetical protein
VTPTLAPSVRLSLSAFRREAWLAALGLLFSGARRLCLWPALWAAGGLLVRAALAAVAQHPLSLAAPLEAVAAMASSGRFLGLVGGLWLCGVLLAGALRVAWVAGALPVLAAAMAGRPHGAAGFAPGLARGFARVLPAALLGFALELSGLLFAATLGWAVLLVAAAGEGTGGAGGLALAAASALALMLVLAVPLALSTAADGLVVRAAVRREPPARALAGLTRRFLARPGSFLLGAMLFGVASLVIQAAVQAAGGTATGFARAAPALLSLGPQLMLGALAALGAAVVDLVWLGTLAVLTCGRSGPAGVTSAASAGWRSSGPAA